MKWLTGVWVIVGAAASLAGCGGSDDEASAADKCNTLVNDLCGHAADCIVEGGYDPGHTRAEENDACLVAARQNVTCANAVSVGPTYATCIDDINGTACTAFATVSMSVGPPLPTNCKGVILFPG